MTERVLERATSGGRAGDPRRDRPSVAHVLRRVAIVIVVVMAAPAHAERPDLRVDVEPVAYVLRGYSVHLRVALPWQPRLVAGIGAYGFDMPDLMVDLAPANRDEDWDVRLLVGSNLFADYFFGAHPDHGWLAGAQIGAQRFRVRHEGDEGAVDTLVLMARVGYEWHPWPRGFYLFPWLGAVYQPVIGGDRQVGGDEYAVPPIVPYGAIELGWRF